MIPHSLQLKNFLSYGADTQIIDFKPYHLIYLSGKNGHGKSALLDAMTWALWGHARKITNAVKPDQGLLRLGATHMMVLFDFQVSGQLYRVKREFIQTSAKQIVYLEFGLINEAGTVIPLTDKTIRATQDVIERTIRLDYESFINSAFLRQGHANEFSQKSPKDRKEILTTILGLQQFDQLKRLALERVRHATEQRHAIIAVQTTLAAQLQDSHDITLQIQQLNSNVKEIQEQERQWQIHKQDSDRAYQTYMTQCKEYEVAQFKQEQHAQLYKEQLALLYKLWQQWRRVAAQQRRAPDYAALEAQKKETMQWVQHQQQLLTQRLILQESLIKTKEELQRREQTLQQAGVQELQQYQLLAERLKFEQQNAEKNIKAMEDMQKDLIALQTTHLHEKEQLRKKNLDAHQLEKTIAHFEKRKNAYQQFIAKANWLNSESESLEHKKEVAHGNDPSCPLCEQNLSAARRKFLVQRFVRHERIIVHQLTRLQLVIARLKQLLLEQHQQLEHYKEARQKLESLDKELVTLQQKITDHELQLQKMRRELQDFHVKIAEQAKRIEARQAQAITMVAQDVIVQEKRNSIEQVTKTMMQFAYNEHEHKKAQAQYDAIEKQIAEYMALHHEIITQQERATQIKTLVLNLKAQKKELSTYEQLQKQALLLMQEKARLQEIEKKLQEQRQLIQERKEKAREEHGRIKTKQEQIERIEKERKKHQETLEKLAKEIEDYQLIAMAAGKDGIQALLIEEAIPEIEQEANYLLSKLTHNHAHIFIESLRDLKSGGSKETLDINISDPSGIRPYEMFSGGEAFRIDFSLRIAISKLLARRAGTALQTLIIDEGFGSQDEEGLSLIMDALYKIQDDFEKVIVVSHLPSMRDQFPVHFVVEKGASGSKISVVEQG